MIATQLSTRHQQLQLLRQMRQLVTLAVLVCVSHLLTPVSANMYEQIQKEPQLSQFLELVNSDVLVKIYLEQEEGTVFAPNNEAMTRFTGKKDSFLLRYHLVNLVLPTDRLLKEQSVLPRLKGSQPIFVSSQRPDDITGYQQHQHHQHHQQRRRRRQQQLLVNNARLIQTNIRTASSNGAQKQIMHIIDEVLQPTVPLSGDSSQFNPTARQFLSGAADYLDAKNSIMKFVVKVRQYGKLDLYDDQRPSTFFIPVDSGVKSVNDMIDPAVIAAHVVPDQVLFMRTMANYSYIADTGSDQLQVVIRRHSLWRPEAPSASTGPQIMYDVQSSTLHGDVSHPNGTVLAQLVHANIAVKNGVIHLIRKPLLVTKSDVFSILKESQNGRSYEFFNLMQQFASYVNRVMTAETATLFVPSNEAIRKIPQHRMDELKNNPTKLENLLKLHLVEKRVSSDIVKLHQNGVYSVQSDDARRVLYLSVSGQPVSPQAATAGGAAGGAAVVGSGSEVEAAPTLFVDGGGTNATVLIADVLAVNGVVHFIDKVLGVPYSSVGQKLALIAITSSTNQLAMQDMFSAKVGDSMKNFTMFVPSNDAWNQVMKSMPATYKTLFSSQAPVQAMKILNRHLIVGESANMEQLYEKSKTENGVNSLRSKFTVEKTSATEYTIQWDKLKARVVRADLECTNGYIHVIDTVMMRQGDVTTSAATYNATLSVWLLWAAAAGSVLAALRW